MMGTPLTLSEEERLAAFRAGWEHRHNGQEQVGYYIGRPHPPFTECRIVKSLEGVGEEGAFEDCAEGEPGQLITRGDNLMSGYVGNDAATAKALGNAGRWYTNLGDVCFRLRSAADGGFDYYWQSRDSALLIRGGANYAYEQINSELKAFVVSSFRLPPEQVEVAVIGLRVESEHEDACCVTIELSGEALERRAEVEENFLVRAKKGVSKGANPTTCASRRSTQLQRRRQGTRPEGRVDQDPPAEQKVRLARCVTLATSAGSRLKTRGVLDSSRESSLEVLFIDIRSRSRKRYSK